MHANVLKPQARRPLKVAHVMWGMELGGLEQMVVRLTEAGREKGVEPLVLVLGPDGPVRGLLEEARVPLVWLEGLAGMSAPALRRLAGELEAFGADVVHGHDMGPWLNAVATRTLRARTAAIGTFHQVFTPRPHLRAAGWAAGLLSEAVVACGKAVAEGLRRWTPPGARLLTIDNGVPLSAAPASAEARASARAALGLPEGATVLGYLGRLHPEKGVDLLVEAFARTFAGREDVHLVLVGGGPLEEALAARKLPRVHLTGVRPNGQALLAAFDVYVQASRREGRSLSMLEAMAARLPTVAHAIPAVLELHEEGRTGLFVPLEDVEALGGALRRLVDDAGLRAALGEEAWRRAQQHSLEGMVDAYCALYRDAVTRAEV